jgi:hypothetical protein
LPCRTTGASTAQGVHEHPSSSISVFQAIPSLGAVKPGKQDGEEEIETGLSHPPISQIVDCASFSLLQIPPLQSPRFPPEQISWDLMIWTRLAVQEFQMSSWEESGQSAETSALIHPGSPMCLSSTEPAAQKPVTMASTSLRRGISAAAKAAQQMASQSLFFAHKFPDGILVSSRKCACITSAVPSDPRAAIDAFEYVQILGKSLPIGRKLHISHAGRQYCVPPSKHRHICRSRSRSTMPIVSFRKK